MPCKIGVTITFRLMWTARIFLFLLFTTLLALSFTLNRLVNLAISIWRPIHTWTIWQAHADKWIFNKCCAVSILNHRHQQQWFDGGNVYTGIHTLRFASLDRLVVVSNFRRFIATTNISLLYFQWLAILFFIFLGILRIFSVLFQFSYVFHFIYFTSKSFNFYYFKDVFFSFFFQLLCSLTFTVHCNWHWHCCCGFCSCCCGCRCCSRIIIFFNQIEAIGGRKKANRNRFIAIQDGQMYAGNTKNGWSRICAKVLHRNE